MKKKPLDLVTNMQGMSSIKHERKVKGYLPVRGNNINNTASVTVKGHIKSCALLLYIIIVNICKLNT